MRTKPLTNREFHLLEDLFDNHWGMDPGVNESAIESFVHEAGHAYAGMHDELKEAREYIEAYNPEQEYPWRLGIVVTNGINQFTTPKLGNYNELHTLAVETLVLYHWFKPEWFELDDLISFVRKNENLLEYGATHTDSQIRREIRRLMKTKRIIKTAETVDALLERELKRAKGFKKAKTKED